VKCGNCERERPIRCRGLCKKCYYRPGVRDRFERRKNAPPGILASDPTGEPDTPTRAPIGTPWKLRVMEARASSGRGVFHPDDNPTAFLMVSERFWRKVVRRWAKRQLKQGEGKT